MTESNSTSHIYQNEFLSIVIVPASGREMGAILFCASINLTRFLPLSRGIHGICSNPAFKGLQLLKADVSDFARERGIVTLPGDDRTCAPSVPHGDGWYHESLIIKNTPPGFAAELLEFSAATLVKKVLSVCKPEINLPAPLPNADELQKYIESLIDAR